MNDTHDASFYHELVQFGRTIAWSRASSLALPATHGSDATTHAFGLAPLTLAASQHGEWTGRRREGASVNAEHASLDIHSGGTHTECAAHISDLGIMITDVAPLALLWAVILDVPPSVEKNHFVVTQETIAQAWSRVHQPSTDSPPISAVILRSRPSDENPHRAWSGTHPPYFSPDGMRFLVDHQILHLVTDLPSVDPEDDGGALWAHRAFFDTDASRSERPTHATITEMAWIPPALTEGFGLLRLDVIAWPSDAAPSRPIFYPCTPQDTGHDTFS